MAASSALTARIRAAEQLVHQNVTKLVGKDFLGIDKKIGKHVYRVILTECALVFSLSG